jgi:UDP-N-acetylmuramyl pentapeptide synthase/poly-gamma-glutamate capsule biosynthesis protein CapA/YwtB (metallophosphatase superfamily)
MEITNRQERALALVGRVREAILRNEWAAAFDVAGLAILTCPDYREPYCALAEACFLLGDAAMGESYLRLARALLRPLGSVAVESLYSEVALDGLAEQWRLRCHETDLEEGIAFPQLRMIAGGDVLLARQMPGRVALRGAADPFERIAPWLHSADLVLANLESCVSTEGDFLDKGGRQPYYYHNLPEMLDVLVEAGISCIATANNHAMDFGPTALAQQIDILDACGFLHFGSGRNCIDAAMPKYANVRGITVAFIGIETETACMSAGDNKPGIHHVPVADLIRVAAGSIAVARAHADIVIVSPHWGKNWEEVPASSIRNAAWQLIDLGADAVLGHSAHILQGVEFHAGRPIAYDMGTLLFDRVNQRGMKDSALFELAWDESGTCRLNIQPLALGNGRANWAVGDEFGRICELMQRAILALDAQAVIKVVETGLLLEGKPEPSPVRRLRKLPTENSFSPDSPPRVPEEMRRLRSNLVYSAMPLVDGIWPKPKRLGENLEVLGARFASPVRPGRGFVCEVYFRARAPARGTRLEARVVGLDGNSEEAFAYTHPVAEGIHPPASWSSEQIICDRVVVRPVKELPQGRYALRWSLTDLEQSEPATDAKGYGIRNDGSAYLGDLVVDAAAPNGVAGVASPLCLSRAQASNYVGWKGRIKEFWGLEARPWVIEALTRAGYVPVSGDPEIVRDSLWVLVIRIDTDRGAVFFKALGAHNRFEAALLDYLAGQGVGCVTPPLALSADRGWTLLPDCGKALGSFPDRQFRRTQHMEALSALAEIQILTAGDIERLLTIGIPDRRLPGLPNQLEHLLSAPELVSSLTADERRQALDCLPLFRDCCETLASKPFSAALDHGDFHPENIRILNGKPVLFDWDSACLTHPFCSLLLSYDVEHLDDAEDLVRNKPLGKAYLAPWAKRMGCSPDDLTGSLHAAIWLAHAIRALFWVALSSQGRMDSRVAKWIRLWLKNRSLLLDQGHVGRNARKPELRPSRLASPDNPLLLDMSDIASVSGGTWHNVPDSCQFTGMSFNRKYMAEGTSGNLYFAGNSDPRNEVFDAKTADSVLKALNAGAIAAVVPNDAADLPDNLPLLRVDRVMAALDRLGNHVRDRLFTGKRVLVSGTEGKTGFKNMLHHVLSPQIPTHAVTNSSNLNHSIMASLASIRQNDRIAIIEAAGTHPGRLAFRSGLVKPHLFVLTEVGNEHINYHGSQQRVIESKADIVTGLVDGGFGLLNADSRNYAAVRKSVLARRRVPLSLFGSAPGCNGRLLECEFKDNAWTVTADIEGQKIEYRLPLLGEHAPLASVSVLLAAYYLGADVVRAAADFHDYRPYESEGVLRRIPHRGGEILLYDNASRASVLSYQSTLRMAARLTPPAQHGRKIAVIGQMIYLGEESEMWHAKLAEWVDAAGFNRVILVGKYAEITYANMRDPGSVVARFPDYDRRHSDRQALQGLIDAVEATCESGDLLFVKGEIDELGQYLQAHEIPSATPVAQASTERRIVTTRLQDDSALSDLRPLTLEDLPRYRAAIDRTQRTTCQHYFPFFYFLGQTIGHRFLIGEDAGSLCLYYLREKRDRRSLCLFVPPLPLQPAVLERCITRLQLFDTEKRANLFRVDADDLVLFRGRPNTRIVACPQEYVYAPARFLDLSGGKKGNVRREINKIQSLDGIEIQAYRSEYADECRSVLAQWAAMQKEKYVDILYGGSTEACLEQYDRFSRNDLFGKVIRLNGKVCSFGFAGEMRSGMGNIFTAYSDLSIKGINKFIWYLLIQEMQHIEFVNGSHAGDTPGLAFAKHALGPAFIHQPYQVYVG